MPAQNPGPMLPLVTVLLATYNGRRWLPQQLDTILDQRDVRVMVVALDDGSTDGTVEWLSERSATEPRLVVLPSDRPSGRASANFFRLLARAPVDKADFVAFSDQDDVWMADKLARQVALIAEHRAVAVSSNVTSFDSGGRRTLIRKNFPQRSFDYLTESPGPGSTFLMTPELVRLVRDTLQRNPLAATADGHDSLVYAIARARGWRWHIDGESTVDYRQHESNAMGANVGSASALVRLNLIRRKWHRRQAVIHATVGLAIAPPQVRTGLEHMLRLMTTPGLGNRMQLARAARTLRRRPRDRVIIGLLIAAGVW